MQKKLLLINLAGPLLLPGDEVIYVVWHNAIRKFELSPDYQLIESCRGEDFETSIIPKMAAQKQWEEARVKSIISHAKKELREINKKNNENVSEKLLKVKSKGYALGLLSNKDKSDVLGVLSKIGLNKDLFDIIKTGDDGIKKPDVRVFDKMLEKFNPEDIILVGDNPHYDLPMAVKAGINFVAIYTKCFPHDLWAVQADCEKISWAAVSISDYIDYLLCE